MLVAGLKALKKVQGTAAGTAVRPGRAGRVQTLCRGPANGGIPGKATVGARLDDTESLLGGGAGLLIGMRDNSVVALGPYPQTNEQR